MSILSRTKRRFFEDGLSGLAKALTDRVIAPVHVRLVSYNGPYLMKRDGITVDLSQTSLSPLRKYRMRTNFLDYENHESTAVSKFLNPETDVIELGAGIGFISCRINSEIVDSAKQVSVEANPDLIKSVETNRKLNQATFDIYHAAYSPADTSVSITIYEDFRSSGVFDKAGKTGREETVEGVNLASIIQKYDIDRFNLVADIEGAEVDLILEEWDVLVEKCDTLILEFHERNPDLSVAKSKLADSDFACVHTSSDVEVWSQ